MLEKIDAFLNKITMYRLVLYYLFALLAIAALLGQFNLLPYSPLSIGFSTTVLIIVCWVSNKILARIFNVQTNVESAFITALILALIVSPAKTGLVSTLPVLFWAGLFSIASKYVLNIANKHVFNPAAFGVALTGLLLSQPATWWVGSPSMLIFTALGAFLMYRKVQRAEMSLVFVFAALITIVAFSFKTVNPAVQIYKTFSETAILFFASIMLTEPLTAPPTKTGQIFYGALVGFLFAPQVHLGSFYFSPELALLTGNIFSYLISPKGRHVLTLIRVEQAAKGVYNFVFEPDRKIKFKPGQYMEWTLGHKGTDSRGNRRYFTVASSPTENEIIIGVKFYETSSSFKMALSKLKPGDKIVASQLAGDFVLPKNQNQKLAFIAGGIGITPFRSMLKYLSDQNQNRPVITLYSAGSTNEIAYYDVLKQAAEKIQAITVFTLTDGSKVPSSWKGYRGYINSEMLKNEIPDYKQRTFYISGPRTMVNSAHDLLLGLGVPKNRIKTDFFPGLA